MEEEGHGGVVPSRVHYRGMHFWNIPRTIFGITSLMPIEKGEIQPVFSVRMVSFHDLPELQSEQTSIKQDVFPLSRDVHTQCNYI